MRVYGKITLGRPSDAEGNKPEIQFRLEYEGVHDKLVSYVDSGEIFVDPTSVKLLFGAADFYKLDDLKNWCFKFIMGTLSMEKPVHSVAELLHLVARCSDRAQRLHCAGSFILKRFVEYSRTDFFNELELETVKTWLYDSRVCVPPEAFVFEAAASWVNYKPELRGESMFELLRCVRLHLLPTSYIRDVVQTSPECSKSQKCQRYIEAAIAHREDLNRQVDRVVSEYFGKRCKRCKSSSKDERVETFNHTIGEWVDIFLIW